MGAQDQSQDSRLCVIVGEVLCFISLLPATRRRFFSFFFLFKSPVTSRLNGSHETVCTMCPIYQVVHQNNIWMDGPGSFSRLGAGCKRGSLRGRPGVVSPLRRRRKGRILQTNHQWPSGAIAFLFDQHISS